MKLLTKPSYSIDQIELKTEAYVETKFHPLGIFGFGPIATSKAVPARTMCFPGRKTVSNVEIDFEDADAIATCLYVGKYKFRGKESREDYWIKNKMSFTLMFDGLVYILHGVIPLECLRENVWECSIDFFEF